MAATVAIRGQRSLLRQIREALAGGGPAQQRLDMVVRIIALSMVAEVCSIYLRRANGEMELFATEGLDPGAVHVTRMKPGEGLITDMRAVRKDYFLDHDHSAYVDQWDWEKAIRAEQRNLNYLTETVESIWSVIKGAETFIQGLFPQLKTDKYSNLPDKLTFIHAEELLARYPALPRKARETEILQEFPAVFIYGIGWILEDGYPHEMRAADYDDWVTETTDDNGRRFHGLNGDILVWNPVTRRRHELSSMGIRVNAETLQQQLKISGQLDFLKLPYHKAVINNEVPLSIGGGIGQSRTVMLLLRKAHLGEVSVTVWPKKLKELCRQKNIRVLE